MKHLPLVVLVMMGAVLTGRATSTTPGPQAATPVVDPAGAAAGEAERSLVKTYCAGCHSDRGKAGGLSLASFDPARAAASPEVAEKIVRKLSAGMMPPAGAKRPEPHLLAAFQRGLESRLDRAAAARPNPGWRPFQRLTRPEYAAAVKDLLDLHVDPTLYLPPDTNSHGFDNVADRKSVV